MGKSEHSFGNNDEWCTEPAIFEPIVRVWGYIGLDPSHSPASRVPARIRIWHPHHLPLTRAPMIPIDDKVFVGDGLQFSWHGVGLVFDNCRYSDIAPWARKHSVEFQTWGTESILYIPARTGATYWEDLIWPTARAICFLKRGQKFEQYGEQALCLNKKSKSFGKPMATPWHSVLCYWGTQLDKFKAAYQDAGRVVVL